MELLHQPEVQGVHGIEGPNEFGTGGPTSVLDHQLEDRVHLAETRVVAVVFHGAGKA